jgi:hypothetical protein
MKTIYFWILGTALIVPACGSFRTAPQYELSTGYYQFRQKGEAFKPVFVETTKDTVHIYPVADGEKLSIVPSRDEIFQRRSFDIDLTTAIFKYRKARVNLPRQLNVEFNGHVYLGYRIDRYQVHYSKTPAGVIKNSGYRGITVGAFGGLGVTAVTPWTTNYQMMDEYHGLVLTHGFAGMIGLGRITGGLGLGWDYLTDRDKAIWIYQGTPWLGVLFGININ